VMARCMSAGVQLVSFMIPNFYNMLEERIQLVPKHDMLIVKGDFNAKVGQDNYGMEAVMGKHGMGVRNNNRERLVEICQQYGMVIGGTLFMHKDIHKYTWTSPNGATRN
jgi:hypothetical protein